MPIHVAIMLRPYLWMILDGRKTVESRLTRMRRAPFRAIKPGERIFFKASAGPFMATAVAGEVAFFDCLTPAKVRRLRRRYNGAVRGDDDYWRAKRDSRYATFIALERVQPLDVGPRLAPSRGRAWFVLDDDLAPPVPVCFEVTLSAGAIRNRYVRIARRAHAFAARHYGGANGAERGEALRLLLPGGGVMESDVLADGMLRRRAWGAVFERCGASPGDRLRFVEAAPGEYRVALIRPPTATSRRR